MESSNRKYFLLIGIFFLIIFIVWTLLGRQLVTSQPVDTLPEQNNPQTTNNQQQVSPIENNTPIAPTILINTVAGEPFAVDNFLNRPTSLQVDENVYLIAQAQSSDSELFQIYFNQGGTINISLLDENLTFARAQAEAALRELIDVSDLRLCSLAISTTVPAWLSQQLGQDYSGVDYGLSFCPRSLPLE